MKAIEKTLKDGKNSHAHRLKNCVKMSILTNVINIFNVTLFKISMTLFTEPKKNPKIHIEAQQASSSQVNPEQKEQSLRHHNP